MSVIEALKSWKGPSKMVATIRQEAGQYVVCVDGIPLENVGDDHGKALGIRQSLLLSSQEWELV